MRPISLKMTAFGPYAGEESIDFTALNERNIFVITGPTGAGKTTIFDAISYAIYGRGSSRDRDGENLRSDFASGDTLTAVELAFELRGKKYWIKRIPKQQRKKSRGEGYTEQLADAELRLVDETNALPVCGVVSVNEKMQEIVGLTYEQFRQIMMIPQGEFRELITSDSKDREKILQKLFGTEVFARVQDKLFDMTKELESKLLSAKTKRDENILQLDYAHNQPLKELVTAKLFNVPAVLEEARNQMTMDKQHRHQLKQNAAKQEQATLAKVEQICQAEDNNKKIANKEQAQQRLNELENRRPQVEQQKNALDQARKALELAGYEENRISRMLAMQAKERDLANVAKTIVSCEEKLRLAKQQLALESAREAEKNQLIERQAYLKGLGDKVKALVAAKASYTTYERERKAAEQRQEQLRQEREKLNKQVNAFHQSLNEARKSVAQHALEKAEFERLERVWSKLDQLQTQYNRLGELRAQYSQQQSSCRKVEEAYKEQEAHLAALQQLFFKGQAGLLAHKLQAGEPCPVCGSEEHPLPAALPKGVPSEETLQQQDEQLQNLKRQYETAKAVFDEVNVQGKAQKRIVEGLKIEAGEMLASDLLALDKEELTTYIVDNLTRLWQQISDKKGLLSSLQTISKQEGLLEEQLQKATANLEQLEQSIVALSDAYTSKYAEVQSTKKIIEGLEQEIPREISSEHVLQLELAKAEQQYTALQRVLKQAEQQYRACQTEFDRASAEQQAFQKAAKDAQTELEEAKQRFVRQLSHAGFADEATYQTARKTEEEVLALEREITTFYENLKSATDTYQQTEKSAEGLTSIDIAILESQLAELKQASVALQQQITEVYARLQHNTRILDGIKDLAAEIDQLEERYAMVGELSSVARGNNPSRLTFERYVLAAFFDDIVAAANLRFGKMTNRRYVLHRIAVRGKGNAQSGLELEVFDNYTGRARHVKTLSGGESFKASLALALGLADVVQAYAGGVSLDTMFIDEGFGTLDPDSLDSAVETLIELQNAGRLVGIISHVPELKERISARLEVSVAQTGSTLSWSRFS